METDKSLTETEAAEFLGVAKATLRILRSVGTRENRMPPVPYYKYGPRCVRYSLADLRKYRENFRVDESAA